MNNQAKIIAELQRMGIDPSGPIEGKDYDKARLAIRTVPEIVEDGGKMLIARAKKALNIHQVPLDQAVNNLEICRTNTCGSYDRLADGREVCHRCNCTGKDLHNKTRLIGEVCPAGLWTNA